MAERKPIKPATAVPSAAGRPSPTPSTPTATPAGGQLFGRENYIWIIVGLLVIGLGLILMAGGSSNDPNTFNPAEVHSKTRITVAPLLILLGLGIEAFAIFRKPKRQQ
jgi:hypothetical protein